MLEALRLAAPSCGNVYIAETIEEIVDDAEASGELQPGGTIVEGTSGNTGAGLAMVGAVRGYPCTFVIANDGERGSYPCTY